ncbi:unnamed protein product, partial [marine sediment metagenome]
NLTRLKRGVTISRDNLRVTPPLLFQKIAPEKKGG